MGRLLSQGNIERCALQIYKDILQHEPCLLPDVGIDESLLKYSGPDSNNVLQALNKEMLNTVPDYVSSLGASLGALTTVPNAVGLGALVISMIIEIAIKRTTQTTGDDTYSLLRRVFGEEKASGVRDTMSEYLKRHQVFMNNGTLLQEEIRRLEQQLSKNLTILRNSLLHDGQMSSRGFKIWVNGAAFHLQMLIHEARLDVQAGKNASDCVREIETAIDECLVNLDQVLEKYKIYMVISDMFVYKTVFSFPQPLSKCHMKNTEIQDCMRDIDFVVPKPCAFFKVRIAFMDVVYSNYEPIIHLKSYFLNVRSNLYSRIVERGSFTVPPGKR